MARLRERLLGTGNFFQLLYAFCLFASFAVQGSSTDRREVGYKNTLL